MLTKLNKNFEPGIIQYSDFCSGNENLCIFMSAWRRFVFITRCSHYTAVHEGKVKIHIQEKKKKQGEKTIKYQVILTKPCTWPCTHICITSFSTFSSELASGWQPSPADSAALHGPLLRLLVIYGGKQNKKRRWLVSRACQKAPRAPSAEVGQLVSGFTRRNQRGFFYLEECADDSPVTCAEIEQRSTSLWTRFLHICIHQGSYVCLKSLKVLEFHCCVFHVWKVLGF